MYSYYSRIQSRMRVPGTCAANTTCDVVRSESHFDTTFVCFVKIVSLPCSSF